MSAVNIDGEGVYNAEWSLKGSTATFGTSGETLITINGVKSLDGIKISGSTVTISKASLGTSKITISNGYTLKLGDDVSKSTVKQAWSLSGTTATYKQTTSAGYLLENNTITYTKKTTKTLATVKGVKSTGGLKVSGKKITVSNASLRQTKVTVSNGYTLSNNAITYSKKVAKTLATIKGVKATSGLSVNGKKITLKNSALNKKVTVSGSGYNFDFAKDYTDASITGSKNADAITARGKNISIIGGKGNDTITNTGSNVLFDYSNGDGNDLIKSFGSEDTISIASGKISGIAPSGKDVVFTVGKGKITVEGGKGKSISYINADGKELTYPDVSVSVNAAGTAVKLLENYSDDVFNVTEFSDFAGTAKTINGDNGQQTC